MYHAAFDGATSRILSAISVDGLNWTQEGGVKSTETSYVRRRATIPRRNSIQKGVSFMDLRSFTYYVPACMLLLLLGSPGFAHEADLSGPNSHRDVTAVITRIHSGLMQLEIKGSPGLKMRPRHVSVNKAERMGLHKAKVGDEVVVTLDEANVLLDVHDKNAPIHGHRLLVGNLAYADPFWEVIELFTSEGLESFAVDPGAGSKLSGLKEGILVRVELDEANVLIDIHPFHH